MVVGRAPSNHAGARGGDAASPVPPVWCAVPGREKAACRDELVQKSREHHAWFVRVSFSTEKRRDR